MTPNRQLLRKIDTAQSGTTLVEAVVILGIVGVVLASSTAILTLQKTTQFDGQAQALLGTLRAMQSRAQAVDGNLEYGVSFTTNSYTAYSRNPGNGTITNLQATQLTSASLASTITPNDTKITFSRLTGLPSGGAQATVTLSRTNPTKSAVIQITSAGVIYGQ